MPAPSEWPLSDAEWTGANDGRVVAIQQAVDAAIVAAMDRMAAYRPVYLSAEPAWSSGLPPRQAPQQEDVVEGPVDGCDCVYCQTMRDITTPQPPPQPRRIRPRRILEVPSNLSERAIARLRARGDIELRFVDPKPVIACPAGYEGEDD